MREMEFENFEDFMREIKKLEPKVSTVFLKINRGATEDKTPITSIFFMALAEDETKYCMFSEHIIGPDDLVAHKKTEEEKLETYIRIFKTEGGRFELIPGVIKWAKG